MKLLGLLFILISIGACSSNSSRIQSSGAPYFIWPVRKGTLTQRFKMGRDKHQGIDIAASKNTTILAAESGKVIYAGEDFSGYGNLIIIEHRGDQWATFYAHLNDFNVHEGQRVFKGQKIGLMGKTGRATGVHLHFEIRHNLRAIDPLQILSSIQLANR